MDKISIIVPIYKVEPYIKRCVDSLINQTYKNIQIILVDDGSPDNCGKICDEYAKKDNRIICIHKQNGGLSSARNSGLDWIYKNSEAQWISFVDSDDFVHERYIELLYQTAVEYCTDVSVCSFAVTDSSEYNVNIKDVKKQILDPEKLWCENITNAIVSWGKLYKRHIWNGLYFPIGKIREDEFVIYKIIFKNKASIINAPLYFYFKNQNSITRSEWVPNQLSILDAKKEQIEFFKKYGFENAYYYTIINYIYRYSVAIRQIEKILPKYEDYYKRLKKEQKITIKKYKSIVEIPYASMYSARFPNGIKSMNIFQKFKFIILYIKQTGIKRILKKV